MIYLVMPIGIVFIIAYAVACFWEKPMSYTIPSTIIGIDIILFLFYVINIVYIGICCIGVLMIISLGYIIYSLKMNKLSKIDFPVILFIVGLIGVCIYCKGNIVREWDSLRLWGAYPKALYYTREIQLSTTAWINPMESTYIPGMPLLAYFFESFFPEFREDVLFVVYAFLNMSYFLPALGKMKNKATMFLGLPLMILMPVLFYSSGYNWANYYKALYIDPCLGMGIGYLVYSVSAWDAEDKTSVFNLLLAMCGVIMLKDIGALFALIVLLACGIKLFKNRNLFKIRNAVYLLPFLAYFIWEITTSMHGVSNHAVSFEDGNLFQAEGIRQYIHYISHSILIITLHGRLNPYLTIVNFLLFFIVCGFGLWLILQKTEAKSNYFCSMISMLVIQFVYLICLYISVVTFDTSYMSTIRYESALMLGFFSFLTFVFLDNWTYIMAYIKEKKVWIVLVISACLFIIVSFPQRWPEELESPAFEKAEFISDRIRDMLAEENENTVKVCMLCDGHEALLYQRIYFTLIGEVDVRPSTNLEYDTKGAEENIGLLLNHLTENGCEYVFTLDNSKLLFRYTELFDNNLEDYTLYRVEQNGKKAILSKVSN